jgi:hypothetical protein
MVIRTVEGQAVGMAVTVPAQEPVMDRVDAVVATPATPATPATTNRRVTEINHNFLRLLSSRNTDLSNYTS